jgi:VWFA-related protein
MLARQGKTGEDGVLRVTTRLVQINVVITDKNGAPVRDLKKDDFAIFDQGREQKISFFSKESEDGLPANSAPLPAGIISNRSTSVTSGGKVSAVQLPSSLTVILLDGLNTSFPDQRDAKDALIKFLSQLQPGDRVAIYTLSNRLRILHDFTSDTAALLEALAKHRNQESPALAASSYTDAGTSSDDLDTFLNQANERIASFNQSQRTLATLEAFEAISRHVAGVPGRKNLVWLSGSFPAIVGQTVGLSSLNDLQKESMRQTNSNPNSIEQGASMPFGNDARSFSLDVQRALRVMNDVGIAVYPVDARGLLGAFAVMPSMAASSPIRTSRQLGISNVDRRAEDQLLQTQSTMNEIADRTGGRAYMNTNDLTGAIRHAVDDGRVTYLIAYTPSHNEWNSQFREIKIKLKKPGLEARYRQGYFAYPESPTDPKTREAALMEAVRAPLPATALGLMARVADMPSPGNSHATVRVSLDAHEVAFKRNAQGRQAALIDLFLVVFDASGKAVHQEGQNIDLNLEDPVYDKLLQSGINMTITPEAPPTSARVRVVVHDVSTGRVGSVDLPMK